MEVHAPGTSAHGSLDGEFVEIHGVKGAIAAQDAALCPLGEQVDPNGRRGVAHWDQESASYLVETVDGLVLDLPEAHLCKCDHVGPEAGGYDLVWPTVSVARAGATFFLQVARVLATKGYCLVDMPVAEEMCRAMGQAAAERGDFTLPKEEFEETFLGHDHNSKLAWLADASPPGDLGSDPLAYYYRQLLSLSRGLLPVSRDLLGYAAWEHPSHTLLRMTLLNDRERQALSPGPVSREEAEEGLVEMHLDFVQRRRLCAMYFIRGDGGVLMLQLRQGQEAQAVRIQTSTNKLLLFRHDLLHYAYAGNGGSDLVLQTWLLEEPQQLRFDCIHGSQEAVAAILGSPKLSLDRQVHVMAAMCRFPGAAYRLERDWLVYATQTDTFKCIPINRFDMDVYYDDGSGGQFNASGKSSTKHAGLLADEELLQFDNMYFGIEAAVAERIGCIQRVCMETSWEMLVMAGFTRETINGAKMYTCVADIGMEWDPFQGLQDSEAWLAAGPMQLLTCNRLCHTLGIVGPCHQVDTACSASLVASNMCHAYLRQHDLKGIKMAMSIGQQHILQPWPMIGLSAAGMLGSGGRCKTFDQSANGYNRGEGCGGLFSKVSDSVEVLQERLACYVSSYVNQDGRSASLTAPNGPSQQMVIRGSLQQGEISPDLVVCTENHGTGTALGDPIETGSIRSVFRRRDCCLPITSAKSHMGHLECGAGSVGILKTLCSVIHGGVPPNCHLRHFNAHCDTAGFPGIFPVELCDIGTEYHHAGANGFGFGGTNSRADFWAHRRNAVHSFPERRREVFHQKAAIGVAPGPTLPLMPRLSKLDYVTVACARCLGPMCWLCGAAAPDRKLQSRHRCTDVRSESASYLHCSECYEGDYQRGGPAPDFLGARVAPGQRLYMAGTWSAWRGLDEMEQLPSGPDMDAYEGKVTLGDTRLEEFLLVLKNGRSKRFIRPVAKRAGWRVRIVGPTDDAEGKSWLIDGHLDGRKEGTRYRVRFEWADFRMSITWKPMEETSSVPTGLRAYQHRYYIANSLSSWKPIVGTHDKDDPALWRWFTSRIPAAGRVELLFLRDEDQAQMIYPMFPLPTEGSVPVVGPDEGGSGKRWLAWGKEGEALVCSLRIQNGDIKVTVKTETMGERTWFGSTGKVYYAAGSWGAWRCEEMEEDPSMPDLRRCRFALGPRGREEFQIVVNQNWSLRMYPACHGSRPGESIVCGPDRRGNRKNWEVVGPPGLLMEIVLDLGAEDHCNIVTCGPCVPLQDDSAPAPLQ